MLLPQVECLLGRKLGEDDDGLGLPGAQRGEVRLAVSDGLELDALEELQLAVLDEQHFVADVPVERGSHLAFRVHGIGQFIDQEVERHVDVVRVFTLLAEVKRRRRQALSEGFGLSQQRCLAVERVEERRAAVAIVAGLGDGSAVEHDGGAEAHRLLAGEICHLEVLQRDAVLLGDVFHGKS